MRCHMPAGAGLSLLLVIGLASCGGTDRDRDPDSYSIHWRFVNNSTVGAKFDGVDEHTFKKVSVFVSGQSSDGTTTTTPLASNSADLRVQVSVTPANATQAQRTEFASITAQKGTTIEITATWNGTSLAISTGTTCSRSVTSNASLFEPSAAACEGPTWTLEGVTGQTSANWQGNSQTGIVTGTGALSIDFPQTVSPGETVTLGVTFTGAVNWQGPGGPPIVLTLKEFVGVGGVGYIANATKSIGTASPTASGSLTVSPSYTFPASNAGNKIEITIQASMNLFTFFFAPDPVATYRLSP